MSGCLEPVAGHDPGYPPLSDLPLLRREALRALALAALGGLGLELVGCPGTGGGGGGLDWLPWRDRGRVAGDMEPVRAVPVAVVVGGAPIDVTFQDGQQAALAVALVVPPDWPGATTLAARQVEAVRAAAASLPGGVLDDAAGLRRLEARLVEELARLAPDLPLDAVEVAPALLQGARSPASRQDEARAPADEAAPPGGAAAVESTQAARLWVPCSKAGCTSCGAPR